MFLRHASCTRLAGGANLAGYLGSHVSTSVFSFPALYITSAALLACYLCLPLRKVKLEFIAAVKEAENRVCVSLV